MHKKKVLAHCVPLLVLHHEWVGKVCFLTKHWDTDKANSFACFPSNYIANLFFLLTFFLQKNLIIIQCIEFQIPPQQTSIFFIGRSWVTYNVESCRGKISKGRAIDFHPPAPVQSPLGYFENSKRQYNHAIILENTCNPSYWGCHCIS